MNLLNRIGLLLIFCLQGYFLCAQTGNTNKADSFGVIITQNSTYLFPGQEFEINVFSPCDSKAEIQEITIGGSRILLGETGSANFKLAAGSLGLHQIPVTVLFKTKTGLFDKKFYTVEYTVGQASACVGLDRMNVLYMGIDNPISVAASGAGDDKITVSISGGGGRITKIGAGRYNVRVNSLTDECHLSIFIDDKIVGAYQCRVRNLPVPTGAVAGYTSGDSVSAGAFKEQQGVYAFLKDFPFDLKYTVSRYTLNVQDVNGQTKSANCSSAYFSEAARELMKIYLRPGTMVIIGNLFVKSGDGKEMKLAPLVYHIK